MGDNPMKEKMRGSIYGIGIALVLFGLLSMSVVPNVGAAETWKEEGRSNEEDISASPTSSVDLNNGQFELDTTLNPGSDNDGCACYCGQGIVMGGDSSYDGIKWIESVTKLSTYEEMETDNEYECVKNDWDGYTLTHSGDWHTRKDTWNYYIRETDGSAQNSGDYSCYYNYHSPAM